MSMETFRRRKDASLSMKIVNATMCWSTLGLCASVPFLYANGDGQMSRKMLVKFSILSCATPLLFFTVDWLTSTSDVLSRNMKILRQNGYGIPRTFIYALINGWIHHIGVWLASVHASGYKKQFNWKVGAIMLGNTILSDIIFRFAHKALHEVSWLAPLHLMHHCAKWPGLSLNLIFNPIDLIIEFGLPISTVLFTYHFVSKNKFGLLLSTSLLYTWYNSDHDETLNTPHVKHHKAVSGIYTVYASYDDGTKHELIRGILNKNATKYKQKNQSKAENDK